MSRFLVTAATCGVSNAYPSIINRALPFAAKKAQRRSFHFLSNRYCLTSSALKSPWILSHARLLSTEPHPHLSRKLQMMSLSERERYANENIKDADVQAAFYASLLPSYPDIVISRYLDSRVARNAVCDSIYSQAMLLTKSTTYNTDSRSYSRSADEYSDKSYYNDQSKDYGSSMYGQVQPIRVLIEETKGQRVGRMFRAIIIWGACIYVFTYGLDALIEASGIKRIWSSGKVEQFTSEDAVSVKFEDVCGVEEAKEELKNTVEFLKNPKQFSKLGGKLPKGILLTGPPGTGKTLLAKAVAGEADVPFFVMSGSQFDEVFVGVGAKRVRELFAMARAKAPSIVFIDELDAIGSKRNAREPAHSRQTLNQLLVELDGFASESENDAAPTVFMAATNFPESLDPALIRPGRFDLQIHVPLPDVRGRIDILRRHARKIKTSQEVDFSVLARGTPGFSGADLANLINQAAVQGGRMNQRFVTMAHLDWAKDKILMGAERRSHFVPEKNKLMTAYHEGGHALVAILTEAADKPYKATIMPRGSSLGSTIMLPEMDRDNYSFKEYLARLDVAMGGRVAEEIVYGKDGTTSGAHNDIKVATEIAQSMVSELGFSDKIGPVSHSLDKPEQISHETLALIESEVRLLLEASFSRVMKLLSSRRKELDRVAKALVEYEYLTFDEMKQVMSGGKLPSLSDLSKRGNNGDVITSGTGRSKVSDRGSDEIYSGSPVEA